jgi:ATP-dependent Lon protease
MFITTANILDTIPPVLLDRMEVIRLPGYTDSEKLQIAKRYLFPRQIENHGLTRSQIAMPDRSILKVIQNYTREAGVRNLDREMANICRKVAKEVAMGKKAKTTVKVADVASYLGPERFLLDRMPREGEIGVVPGLAYNQYGGDVLYIETNKMPGRGNLTLTGSLGDVMKESVRTALSCVRASAADLCIENSEFTDYDVHVHFPAGAVPKDGPSAGITIAVALVSLFCDKPVKPKLSMTGEITLSGVVLPIGGLKEKCLAAYRHGFKEIVLPTENKKDLSDLPAELRGHFKFHFVSKVDEVFKLAFPAQKKSRRKSTRK